jgi:hypothetical protein
MWLPCLLRLTDHSTVKNRVVTNITSYFQLVNTGTGAFAELSNLAPHHNLAYRKRIILLASPLLDTLYLTHLVEYRHSGEHPVRRP